MIGKNDINLKNWIEYDENNMHGSFENDTYYHIGFLDYDKTFHYLGIHKYNGGFIENTYHIRPSHFIKIKQPEFPEASEYYIGELYNADPNCKHVLNRNSWGGIKCLKCSGWFCY